MTNTVTESGSDVKAGMSSERVDSHNRKLRPTKRCLPHTPTVRHDLSLYLPPPHAVRFILAGRRHTAGKHVELDPRSIDGYVQQAGWVRYRAREDGQEARRFRFAGARTLHVGQESCHGTVFARAVDFAWLKQLKGPVASFRGKVPCPRLQFEGEAFIEGS